MKKVDDRVLENTSYELVHRIKKKIRECEKYNIDIDAYVDKDALYAILEILDCCLNNKDNKKIIRRK